MPGVFLDPSPPYISGRIFPCNPESCDSASPASQFAMGIPSLSPKCWNYRRATSPQHVCGCWWSGFWSLCSVANALPSEPYPYPPLLSFLLLLLLFIFGFLRQSLLRCRLALNSFLFPPVPALQAFCSLLYLTVFISVRSINSVLGF